MTRVVKLISRLDFVLLAAVLVIVAFGLVTMRSFGTDVLNDYYFLRQLIWLIVSLVVFFVIASADWSFLKTNSIFLLIGYAVGIGALVLLLVMGYSINGAQSWIPVGPFHVEPVEFVKLILVLILAKYFSRRYVAIGRLQTLIASLMYVAIPIVLILAQPDFGSAAVIGVLWLGMALVGEMRVRHLLLLAALAVAGAFVLWHFVFLPYQKARIINFINPYNDVRGAGYHALQSMIAVGSGKVLGKGIGYGTQSRLQFLPENETDFIFAAFAEEWGLIGVFFLFFFFGVVLWRMLRASFYAESNFEKLFAVGFALIVFFQALIHIGMNIGLLPITGLGMPFMSYGGSSLVSMFAGLGILQSFMWNRKGIVLGFEDRFKEGLVGS
jgi:rod shape determining protein RodA